jgi:hypothetical protein
MGLSTKEFLGALALVLGTAVVVGGGAVFSGVGGNMPDQVQVPGQDNSDGIEDGKSATVELAAYDETASSQTQVAADIHVWRTGDSFYLGSKTGSTTDRTSFSSLVTGQEFKAVAFNDQYPYAAPITKKVDAETVLGNLKSYEGVSTSNIVTEVKDENGDTLSSAISLGSEEQYALSGLNVEVSNNNVGYNPKVIAVEYTENISSVEMPGATEVEVPDSALGGNADAAFVPGSFNPQQGEPFLTGWESAETGNIVVTADQDGTSSSDSLDIAVLDSAAYITQSDKFAYGVNDDASTANDVGIAEITETVNFE